MATRLLFSTPYRRAPDPLSPKYSSDQTTELKCGVRTGRVPHMGGLSPNAKKLMKKSLMATRFVATMSATAQAGGRRHSAGNIAAVGMPEMRAATAHGPRIRDSLSGQARAATAGSAFNVAKERSNSRALSRSSSQADFSSNPASPGLSPCRKMSQSLTRLPPMPTHELNQVSLSELPGESEMFRALDPDGQFLPMGVSRPSISGLVNAKKFAGRWRDIVAQKKMTGDSSPKNDAQSTPSTASLNGDDNDEMTRLTTDATDQSGGEEEEKESLPDVSFVIPGAPTITEAVARLKSGLTSDSEQQRVIVAYRRFSCGEEDLDKERLDLVVSHLGYLLIDEEEMDTMANNVSEMSAFDLDELVSFLQGCAQNQREVFNKAFKDNAKGGAVSVDDLPLVMKDLSLVVLEDNMVELLLRAGLHGKTSFNWEEALRVVATHRTCQGFTVEELEKAKEVFEEHAEGERLQVPELANTILDFFGVSCVKHLRELVEAAGEVVTFCGTHTPSVSFHEFLIWARQLENAGLLELFEFFEDADHDDDGRLSLQEMICVVKEEGFTLFDPEVTEFLEAAELPVEEGATYSFEDVHSYLDACRESEGFSKASLVELKAAFDRFDTEGGEEGEEGGEGEEGEEGEEGGKGGGEGEEKEEEEEDEGGELTTVQVLDLMRFLGYQLQVQDVERYAKLVDFNGNGTMDIDEYMRLMRLHREDELDVMSATFCKETGNKRGLIPYDKLHDALINSKCCSSHCDVFEELCGGSTEKKPMCFEEFKVLADKGRSMVKRAQRKKANFSDEEFSCLRQAWAEYDVRGAGFLDQKKMFLLLHRCAIPVHHQEDRGLLLNMLDQARQAALEAEISPEDVGESGDCPVTFWTMVHAWRIIARNYEMKNIKRCEEARVAAKFSVSEVEEFQTIFTNWIKPPEEPKEEETPAPQGRRKSMPDLYSSAPKAMAAQTSEMLNNVKNEKSKPGPTLPVILGIDTRQHQLEFWSFKKLLGHLKLKLGPKHVHMLEMEMEELTGDCEGALDFADFLRIMRWMMSTNFANMNGIAEDVAKTATVSAPAAEDEDDNDFGDIVPVKKSVFARRKSV